MSNRKGTKSDDLLFLKFRNDHLNEIPNDKVTLCSSLELLLCNEAFVELLAFVVVAVAK